MTAQRKPKSDSVSAAVKAMVDVAKGPPELPPHVRLRDGDRAFWDGIIASRARDEWTPADLVVAAQLARCQADIERESASLDAESSVIENARGTPVCNPRMTILEQLARREMALMRSLRMGGRILGDSNALTTKRAREREAAHLRNELQDEDEDLLAV